MKQSLGAGEWIRRGLGAAVIALGLDTGLLRGCRWRAPLRWRNGGPSMQGAPAMTGGSAMMSGGPAMMAAKQDGAGTGELPVAGGMPSLSGVVQWLNSPPLTADELRGKVVLVDFWTYSCINCLRAIPYVRAWVEKYREQGLVVIGVHTPEFAF